MLVICGLGNKKKKNKKGKGTSEFSSVSANDAMALMASDPRCTLGCGVCRAKNRDCGRLPPMS